MDMNQAGRKSPQIQDLSGHPSIAGHNFWRRRTGRLSRRRSRPFCELLEPRTLLTAVVNNLDSGTGSLRWAIVEAQAPGGDHTIADEIPSGSRTITLLSAAPGYHVATDDHGGRSRN